MPANGARAARVASPVGAASGRRRRSRKRSRHRESRSQSREKEQFFFCSNFAFFERRPALSAGALEDQGDDDDDDDESAEADRDVAVHSLSPSDVALP
jgi:hypothetical protein